MRCSNAGTGALLATIVAAALHAQAPAGGASYPLQMNIGGRTRSYVVDLPPSTMDEGPFPLCSSFTAAAGTAPERESKPACPSSAVLPGCAASSPKATTR